MVWRTGISQMLKRPVYVPNHEWTVRLKSTEAPFTRVILAFLKSNISMNEIPAKESSAPVDIT